MKLFTLIRQALCSHEDTTPKSVNGLMSRECLHCGHISAGIPVGPGWRLVESEGK